MPARDLIFDVGMHRGEDTAYYLRKGYRVIGFEANPRLAAECRDRFSRKIADGRVRIIEGAIVEPGRSSVSFFVNKSATIWGTVDADWAARNPGEVEEVEVPSVDFSALLQAEMPWYLKIDIEGTGGLCVDALSVHVDKPAFVSIESEKVDFGRLQGEISQLSRLGYDRFAAVQQDRMMHKRIQTTDLAGHPFRHRFEHASSGPFGEDMAQDWMTAEQVLKRYRHIFRRYRLLGDAAAINRSKLGFEARRQLQRLIRLPLPGWYDTHAAKSSEAEPG